MDSVEKLYKNYDILNNADGNIEKHEAEYLEILQAVKGSANEKRLASQFIVRFFKQFPSLAEQAIDSVMDLCEDDDVAIRKQAIKDLPHLCRENRSYLPKIADVLAQMLQSDNSCELKEVYSSLANLLKMDVQGCLYGLFSQIQCDDNDENVIRERTIKFLASKLNTLDKDIVTKEVEQMIWSETKKSFKFLSASEFVLMMEVLASTSIGRDGPGKQQLFDLAVAQLTSLDPATPTSSQLTDPAVRNRLLFCTKLAASYVTRFVKCDRLMTHLLQTVLPSLLQLDTSCQLQLLQPLAELSTHVTPDYEHLHQLCSLLLQLLTEVMPLPPAAPAAADGAADGGGEECVDQPVASLQFSVIECLLGSFHQLGRHCPTLLSDDTDTLADFRKRLQYVSRCSQAYTRSVRESLQKGSNGTTTTTAADPAAPAVTTEKSGPLETATSSSKEVLQVALRTTSNISAIVRDLFHTPPIYKCSVTYSWKHKPSATQNEAKIGEKRRAPITFDKGTNNNSNSASVGASAAKSNQRERGVYQPPSGKYSGRGGDFQERRGGRQRTQWRR